MGHAIDDTVGHARPREHEEQPRRGTPSQQKLLNGVEKTGNPTP